MSDSTEAVAEVISQGDGAIPLVIIMSPCSWCGAMADQPCQTPSGRTTKPHRSRRRPAQYAMALGFYRGMLHERAERR